MPMAFRCTTAPAATRTETSMNRWWCHRQQRRSLSNVPARSARGAVSRSQSLSPLDTKWRLLGGAQGVQRAWIERGGQLSHPERSRPATAPTPTTPRNGSPKTSPVVTTMSESGGKRKTPAVAPLDTPSTALTTSTNVLGGTAAAPVPAPATPAIGRSSGRKRRKTWRAMEAAEQPDGSDTSAVDADKPP